VPRHGNPPDTIHTYTLLERKRERESRLDFDTKIGFWRQIYSTWFSSQSRLPLIELAHTDSQTHSLTDEHIYY